MRGVYIWLLTEWWGRINNKTKMSYYCFLKTDIIYLDSHHCKCPAAQQFRKNTCSNSLCLQHSWYQLLNFSMTQWIAHAYSLIDGLHKNFKIFQNKDLLEKSKIRWIFSHKALSVKGIRIKKSALAMSV